MGIKSKWMFSFLPFYTYTFFALLSTWSGRWPTLEARVFFTGGTLLLTFILLMIIQPWKPDDKRATS